MTKWCLQRGMDGCPSKDDLTRAHGKVTPMSKKRVLAFVAAAGVALAAAAAAILPMTASDAATACAAAYNNSTVYTGGMQVSYNGDNWTAKWWTQYEAPSTGGSGVWTDNGGCGGSGGGG